MTEASLCWRRSMSAKRVGHSLESITEFLHDLPLDGSYFHLFPLSVIEFCNIHGVRDTKERMRMHALEPADRSAVDRLFGN